MILSTLILKHQTRRGCIAMKVTFVRLITLPTVFHYFGRMALLDDDRWLFRKKSHISVFWVPLVLGSHVNLVRYLHRTFLSDFHLLEFQRQQSSFSILSFA